MTTFPIRETRIRNGPLLMTHAMPGVQTVAFGIFLNIGSRDEDEAQAGIAHALEHMLFKGTKDHNVHALSELLDMLGGTANAFTARERTCFYMRVLREDWKAALSVLCSMVLTPTLPEDEWQREREVIFSEMSMAEDSPEDWVFDRHIESLYPDQSLGRPVLGRRETLSRFSRGDLATFLRGRYRPPRMLIAAAGCVDHKSLIEHLDAYVWPRASVPVKRAEATMASGVQTLERNDEQAHIVCSFPGITSASAERPVAWIANQMLGGGMSSRLFREVREKRGLAYAIGSHLSGLSNTGAWTISGSADPRNLGECTRIIRDVLTTFDGSLTQAGMDRARRQLEVSLRMGMDSSEANMLHLGGRFDEHEIKPRSAWVEDVRQVSLDRLKAWVRSRFSFPSLWTFSGPAKALATLPDDLQT